MSRQILKEVSNTVVKVACLLGEGGWMSNMFRCEWGTYYLDETEPKPGQFQCTGYAVENVCAVCTVRTGVHPIKFGCTVSTMKTDVE